MHLAVLLVITIGFYCLSGCDKTDVVRHYQERAEGPAEQHQKTSVIWTTPSGWQEVVVQEPMRLASWTFESHGLCTLVSLPGMAGGEEANIDRWLGQLHVILTPDEKTAWMAKAENITSISGWQGKVWDFTTLTSDDSASSMIAASFPVGSLMLFVKMTGPVQLLQQQRDAFLSLCRSLSPSLKKQAS